MNGTLCTPVNGHGILLRCSALSTRNRFDLATAASELARNAFRYASNGAVEFMVRGTSPQLFVISVSDSGPGIPNLSEILDGKYVSRTGLGMGIVGTRRLMDHFEIASSSAGTMVEAGKVVAGYSALGGRGSCPPALRLNWPRAVPLTPSTK